ncbi:hypothetical protein [Brevundimonas diminuta]|uniref:hypothetical protein n=1 Tax=Brevundimonas diminuta TaxID=293 RepID=UPI0035D6A138
MSLETSPKLLYLDQNAWIALARGAWDKAAYPEQHAALVRVIGGIQSGRIMTPLSFTNIYETAKINNPDRRAHLAGVQSSMSGGRVFRGRRRILEKTLTDFLAAQFEIDVPKPTDAWFLSDLWFEAAADYAPTTFGLDISDRLLAHFREDPGHALFSFLTDGEEAVRIEGVRRYTADSENLLRKLRENRALIAEVPFALRRRVYSARLLITELNFILATGRRLGLPWSDVTHLGASLSKSLINDIPVLHAERELSLRLEWQGREPGENDLRDMAAFTTILPLADIFIAEKAFVNLSRQAGLGKKYGTTLLTNVSDLTEEMVQ